MIWFEPYFGRPTLLLVGMRFLRLIAEGKKESATVPTDRGLAAIGEVFWLRFYRGFLEFQFKAEYAYDMGMPHWVARIDHAFSSFHLDAWFSEAPRSSISGSGTEMPLLVRLGKCCSTPKSSRPYIERTTLESVVQSHLKGDRNYTEEIHKLLT